MILVVFAAIVRDLHRPHGRPWGAGATITDIVVALAYEGLDAVARARGYVTLVANTVDDPARRHERILQLLDHGVDAVLHSDAHSGDLSTERSYGVPVLPFLRSAGERGGPTVDDVDGGRQAARHLLDLGHRHIVVVAGPAFASTARDRVRGFPDELGRGGVTVPERWVVTSSFDLARGKAAPTLLLEQVRPPTAVFAVNDFTAIGTMAAARARGLAVSEDVSVVGFNDIPLAGESSVPAPWPLLCPTPWPPDSWSGRRPRGPAKASMRMPPTGLDPARTMHCPRSGAVHSAQAGAPPAAPTCAGVLLVGRLRVRVGGTGARPAGLEVCSAAECVAWLLDCGSL